MLKGIVGEFIVFVNVPCRVGAARRVANKVSVWCVVGLLCRKSSFECVVSSLSTFRLSLSLQAIEVVFNMLCAFSAFGV